MTNNISISGVSVGLGDTNKVNGGSSSLLSAAMGGLSIGGGGSLDFSSIKNSESSSLSGPSVSASISKGASSRPVSSGFAEKHAELQQIAKISNLNSPGVGMSAHEPSKSSSTSQLFESLVA